MIKNLLTVGDSFTYGEELSDLLQAWPYQLAKLINANVINLGAPAASNDKILRTTLDNLFRENNLDLVVIGWTSPGRLEFSDELGTFDIWPGYSGSSFKNSNLDWRDELLSYISKYHNSSFLHLRFLQQVILLQKYLESMNIKYVMVNVLQNEYYKKIQFDGIQDYYKQINTTNFLNFNHAGMVEWAYGCKLGPRGHFLEDGHKIVANKLNEHIRNLGWVS
jgi:hypothetical protein